MAGKHKQESKRPTLKRLHPRKEASLLAPDHDLERELEITNFMEAVGKVLDERERIAINGFLRQIPQTETAKIMPRLSNDNSDDTPVGEGVARNTVVRVLDNAIDKLRTNPEIAQYAYLLDGRFINHIEASLDQRSWLRRRQKQKEQESPTLEVPDKTHLDYILARQQSEKNLEVLAAKISTFQNLVRHQFDGGLKYRVDELCDYMTYSRKAPTSKMDFFARCIEQRFNIRLWKRLDDSNPRDYRDYLLNAIKAQYSDKPDEVEAFLGELESRCFNDPSLRAEIIALFKDQYKELLCSGNLIDPNNIEKVNEALSRSWWVVGVEPSVINSLKDSVKRYQTLAAERSTSVGR